MLRGLSPATCRLLQLRRGRASALVAAHRGASSSTCAAGRAARTPLPAPAAAAPVLHAPPPAAARLAPAAAAATAAASGPAAAAPGEAPQPPLSFEGRPGLRDEEGRLLLKNLTFEELEEWCESIGEGPRRAGQVWRAMYGHGRYARTWEDGAPGDALFSRAFQRKAEAGASLHGGLTLQRVSTAPDGTHKLVFALHGGGEGAATGSVETVLIPMYNRAGTQPRYTACLSSQVGCAMNCAFCYTGRMGLLGNLSAAQVVEQVVEARRWLAARQLEERAAARERGADGGGGGDDSGGAEGGEGGEGRGERRRRGDARPPAPPRINNIVFMGMGEPLHNTDAVLPALDILCSPTGLAFSRSKVIVSTVGLVPELRRLRASGKAKLAVSLHATTDEVRSWIAPVNRKHSLGELMGALAELYPKRLAATPGRSDDFIILEYVMLEGVNDTDDDARRLLALTEDIYCMINLIIFNEFHGTIFKGSGGERVSSFRSILIQGGRVCTVRASKGAPEAAACGMLGDGPAANPRGGAPLLKPPPRLRDAFGEAVERARASMMQPADQAARQQAASSSPAGV
ncbi:23S rRNA (adenine(2503)-C(2))-methyltransferase [Raphidocelis subcapitata]|uniref:23S rRNA (Adenine(2503)-C(2))-methyltransferase n=1 Tax=Raphidocelis subcapitata TaxID=307507 RepID=A0A2V0NR64_9CHLO|nr:23S rRNA (adenine(2503)-C(2))-methyltransferase [Raphidocelis subcapitata]|eukprot:GBF88050.1 23S rRNA (adenine(2503)-C(2))-methyltransferase [Raphidocelis subcapitata]